MLDATSNPLSIDGLWALTPGNGGNGGSANRIYFTAGPNDEANGAFGVIATVPLPGAVPLLASGFVGWIPWCRRKSS